MRHFRHISANSCRKGCSIIEHSSAQSLAAWEQAFSPGTWAAGEDYLLGERVHDLRRDRQALAGRVRGAHGDYWVRVTLDLPAVSACDCGRPRCRHAAAVIQAYHARRLPVTDVARMLDAFLAHPRRAPLAAAAMGEDLVAAMDLPPLDIEDIWALAGERRLLALDAALHLAADPSPLLLRALPEAAYDQDLQALLASALSERPPAPAAWPLLLRRAPQAFAPLLADLRPQDLTIAAILAAVWQAAADGDRTGLSRLAPHAVALAPNEAYHALEALVPSFPELLPSVLAAARAAGSLQRAVAGLLRHADRLPAGEAAEIEAAIADAAELPRRLKLQLRVRSAAASGGAAQLLAARRAALAEGMWPALRPAALRRIHQRPDGPILETQLLLAEGDLEGAARTAEHCRSSPLPEQLVAQALKAVDPAAAQRHLLRAQALSAQLSGVVERRRGRFGGGRGRNPGPGR